MRVRELTEADFPAVRAIYQQGIATGHATFAEQAPDWHSFNADRLPAPRLVAVSTGAGVLGWAALSPTSTRGVYRGVVEVIVYVSAAARGRGVGQTLLEALLERSECLGHWSWQALIFPENTASIRVHEKLGFRVIGHREKLGYMTHGPMAGQWRDIVMLEKRGAFMGKGPAP